MQVAGRCAEPVSVRAVRCIHPWDRRQRGLGPLKVALLSPCKKQFVKLDVSTIDPEFVGNVPIGIADKVRRIYRDRFLVQ